MKRGRGKDLQQQQQAPPLPPQPSEPASDSVGVEEFLLETNFVPSTIDEVDEAPKPAEQLDTIPAGLIGSALEPTFQTIFHVVATMRGPHWELERFQNDALVKGWTPIVQLMLAKLGKSEQVLFTLALLPTMAIVGGKAAQDMNRALSTANTRTPASAASSPSTASATPARPPEPSDSLEELDES